MTVAYYIGIAFLIVLAIGAFQLVALITRSKPKPKAKPKPKPKRFKTVRVDDETLAILEKLEKSRKAQ